MIIDKILEFMKSDRDFKIAKGMTETTSLIRSGAVDSFSIVKLVLFLEKTFGIKILQGDLSERNFDTLKSIEKLVEEKMKKNSP
ncbi:MAG TPA: acyl carrier protein [Candidatus Eisenbacteria bacterium]|jgi:acyl carrier protein|nr:acyl carrier protein [Candidatus Eisenbacteria bacterium]